MDTLTQVLLTRHIPPATQISFSEWIYIAQAVIMLLTGIVIVWYTIETARIRKETSIQNTMLAEQLRLMQSIRQHEMVKEQQELAKEISFIKPYFRFGGGSNGGNQASWDFTNKGGPAKKLSSKALGSFHVSISPSRFLDTNEEGHVNFSATDLKRDEKVPI